MGVSPGKKGAARGKHVPFSLTCGGESEVTAAVGGRPQGSHSTCDAAQVPPHTGWEAQLVQ